MTDYTGFSTRYIGEYQTAMRLELSDAATFFSNSELNRGIIKATALMSRLIPKRAQVETFITIAVEDETLTIASSTGTLTYKPVKYGSVKITGETEGHDQDFTVNHLTGVITEVGSGLADDDYTVNYEIDPYMLDISTLLSDYIKIERIEYPVGEDPQTFITIAQEVYASTLTFKEKLGEDKHIRITYLTYWTAPAATAAPDYPASLDNAIIVGACGEALIFKAEKYVQEAIDALGDLTAPTNYTLAQPDSPTLPSAPSAPTAPTPSWTNAILALDKACDVDATPETGALKDAKDDITSGTALANVAAVGDRPAWAYAEHVNAGARIGEQYINEALAYMRQEEDDITNFAHEVAAFGSEVNAYAQEMAGTTGKYREDINNQNAGIANFRAQIEKYVAQANEQQMKASNWLNIAGRYLASGQAKINEMLILLGTKVEFNMYKSSSEQFS